MSVYTKPQEIATRLSPLGLFVYLKTLNLELLEGDCMFPCFKLNIHFADYLNAYYKIWKF